MDGGACNGGDGGLGGSELRVVQHGNTGGFVVSVVASHCKTVCSSYEQAVEGKHREKRKEELEETHTGLQLVSHSSVLVLLSTSDGSLLESLLCLGILLVSLLEFLLYLVLSAVRGSGICVGNRQHV